MSLLDVGRRWALRAKERAVLGGAVAIGPAAPRVALTFDDGPDPSYTPAILEILRARRARATFFVLGAHVERSPEIGRAVAAEHEIGCHSHAHARESVRSLGAFRADLVLFRRVVQRELQLQPRLFRFPWGDRGIIDPADVVALEGMRCVHWTGSGGDDTLEADGIVARIERYLIPGAILLLHDGVGPHSVRKKSRDETVKALPGVLDRIAARGLETVTVSELLS